MMLRQDEVWQGSSGQAGGPLGQSELETGTRPGALSEAGLVSESNKVENIRFLVSLSF